MKNIGVFHFSELFHFVIRIITIPIITKIPLTILAIPLHVLVCSRVMTWGIAKPTSATIIPKIQSSIPVIIVSIIQKLCFFVSFKEIQKNNNRIVSKNSMSCIGICKKYIAKKESPSSGRYESGHKRCSTCEIFVKWDGSNCPCCGMILRTKPRGTLSRQRLVMKIQNKNSKS